MAPEHNLDGITPARLFGGRVAIFFMPLPAETIVYLSNSCLTALPGHERFTPPRQAVRG